MTFDTLLIANRGEIALRVMRAAKRSGLRTVAVFSDADRDSLHVREADLAVCIGPAEANASYRNIPAILEACRKSGAQAIHPGYGFLSENAEFAQAVADAGLKLVGPSARVIDLMGNKARAKIAMQEAGVPTVPGVTGVDDPDALLAAAKKIGFPVILKAAAGGGGRGMRIARDAAQFAEMLPLARSEALGAFGSGELILEKAIESARHIEIQVLCDEHGNCIHLGERDCSIQRRYQKVIEEAPSPAVDAALRHEMGAIAVKACQAIGYTGVGTLEFLLGNDGSFYFMEMNTRLQVEHGVTEMVTGIDLVDEQLRVAQGERLAISQADVQLRGHAMELRICAEDPYAGFVPQVGRVTTWRAPEGIRVDSALHSGMEVSPFYDSMLAKFMASAPTRGECIRKLSKACAETTLLGIRSNLRFLERCINHPVFLRGEGTTDFLGREDLTSAHWGSAPSAFAEAAAALVMSGYTGSLSTQTREASALRPVFELLLSDPQRPPLPAGEADPNARLFRISPTVEGGCRVAVGDQAEITVAAIGLAEGAIELTIDDVRRTLCVAADADQAWVHDGACSWGYRRVTNTGRDGGAKSGVLMLRAPVSGRVISVAAQPGDTVDAKQTLLVLESMKLEMQISAGSQGTVQKIFVNAGEQVQTGKILAEIQR